MKYASPTRNTISFTLADINFYHTVVHIYVSHTALVDMIKYKGQHLESICKPILIPPCEKGFRVFIVYFLPHILVQGTSSRICLNPTMTSEGA
jgi:hypothetical protein